MGEYKDVLINIERSATTFYRSNPEMKDTEALKAYEAVHRHYERMKKKLPNPPVSLTGNALLVYELVLDTCEWHRRKNPGEPVIEGTADVPVVVLLRSLEKLIKSIHFWQKGGGQRSYLNHVSSFI